MAHTSRLATSPSGSVPRSRCRPQCAPSVWPPARRRLASSSCRSAFRPRATRTGDSPASRRLPNAPLRWLASTVCRRRDVDVDSVPAAGRARSGARLRQRPLRAGAVTARARCRRRSASRAWPRPLASSGEGIEPSSRPRRAVRAAAIRRAEHGVSRRRRVCRAACRHRARSSRFTCCSSRPAAARPGRSMTHPRVLVVLGGEQPGVDRRDLRRACRRALLHERGDRDRARRERDPRSLQDPVRERRGVSRRRDAPAGRSAVRPARSHSISLGGALVRNDIVAVSDGEGVDCTLNGLYLADAAAARRQPHDHRSREAALRQPRGLQGHPRRSRARRLQRQDHRPPRRAEDRRQADQSRAAALRGRADQHETAARDLRERRQVHARRRGRAARRRGDLLSALARA